MTVSIRTHLESDAIRIPEAAGLVGRDVRITVEEVVDDEKRLCWDGKPYDAKRLMAALDEFAEAIRSGASTYDLDAVEALRRRSVL